MPRKSLFTALVAALAILLAPSVAAAAPSAGSESAPITATSTTGAKAKASCPVCGVIALRAAVSFAQHLAKKKAQEALARQAARRGASRAVRPISRVAKHIRAGKEAAAQRVLLTYLRSNQKAATAARACVYAAVINLLAGKNYAEAQLSCVGAAAGVLGSD